MIGEARNLVQPGLFGGDPEPYGLRRSAAMHLEPPTINHQPTTGTLVQVAPGKWAMRGGPDPEYILAEVFRHPDGTLGFRPSGEGRFVKLTPRVGELLGFAGQLHTIRRLARAGFIRMPQPSPCVYMLELDSWFEHMRQTEDDPDFWEPEGENLRKYLMANGLRV